MKTIQREPLPSTGELTELIGEECTDAAIYLQLSRLLPGESGLRLRQMAEQEQAHAACLKGIYTLITGARPPISTPSIPMENPEAMLRRCYGREMRCLVRYERQAEDPDYGKVFGRLARQEQGHCRAILEILAALSRTAVL